jgi:large subunit ribosomal protein L4e
MVQYLRQWPRFPRFLTAPAGPFPIGRPSKLKAMALHSHMSGRKTVNIYTPEGTASGTLPLPLVFDTPIRNDLVTQIYTNLAKNQQQPYATSIKAGVRPSALSWGTGRAKARVPRVNGSGSGRNGQGAYANFCRGGHRFGPPTVQRRWFRPVPLKQRRYAIASAIAASGERALVEARGHALAEVLEIPVVVADAIEGVARTKDAVAVLKAVRLYGDVKRVIEGKVHRSSKGKMRRSAFRTKRGPLVVYRADGGIVKAFRNIPGVDVLSVSRLSLYQLAPGGTLGRLVLWTAGAFGALDQIYSDKRGFELPRPILTNSDTRAIAESDAVLSVLRPELETFAVPDCRCPVRLGIATDAWAEALGQIEALQAAERAKTQAPGAVKALFDEVVAAQPAPPKNLSTQAAVFSGYFDDLHLKADEALESTFTVKEEAPAAVAAPAKGKGGKAAPAAAAPAAAAAAPAKGKDAKAPAQDAKGGAKTPAKGGAKTPAKGGAAKKK